MEFTTRKVIEDEEQESVELYFFNILNTIESAQQTKLVINVKSIIYQLLVCDLLEEGIYNEQELISLINKPKFNIETTPPF